MHTPKHPRFLLRYSFILVAPCNVPFPLFFLSLSRSPMPQNGTRPVSWYASPFYFNSPLSSFHFHFSFFFLTRKNLKIRIGARCYRNGVSLAVVSGGSNGADATGNPVGRDKSTKLLGPARLEICKFVVIRLWIYEACTNDAQCSHW